MPNLDERYEFTSKAKKNLFILLVLGIVFTILGVVLPSGQHGEEHEASSRIDKKEQMVASVSNLPQGHEETVQEEHHGSAIWWKRILTSLWINNMMFIGLGVIGVVFFAIQYASQSAWSTPFIRIPMALGHWLPYALVMVVVVFWIGRHDLFHWTHEGLYVKGGSEYDEVIAGKKGFLNLPFYLARMIVFIGAWILFFMAMKKQALKEDIEGGTSHWYKIRSMSGWFLVFFAVSSSVAAWDWVMSIDTHWFSTMFGWYVFASWFVAGLALITLIVVVLKQQGYLSVVNENHLHDLGKLIFGFSIFWTYIWFSQFLLIYYANIPEEAVYFVQRLKVDQYSPVFFLNLFVNFVFPFLFLMTRDSKRKLETMKIVSVVVLIGHWFDFYLMITPGVMKFDGGFGFIEIGITLVFIAAFFWVVLSSLARYPLIAKNHPTLEESFHHHI